MQILPSCCKAEVRALCRERHLCLLTVGWQQWLTLTEHWPGAERCSTALCLRAHPFNDIQVMCHCIVPSLKVTRFRKVLSQRLYILACIPQQNQSVGEWGPRKRGYGHHWASDCPARSFITCNSWPSAWEPEHVYNDCWAGPGGSPRKPQSPRREARHCQVARVGSMESVYSRSCNKRQVSSNPELDTIQT